MGRRAFCFCAFGRKCNSPARNRAILTGPTATSFHQANSTGGSLVPSNWRQLGTAPPKYADRRPGDVAFPPALKPPFCFASWVGRFTHALSRGTHSLPNAAQGVGVRVWQTARPPTSMRRLRSPTGNQFASRASSSASLARMASTDNPKMLEHALDGVLVAVTTLVDVPQLVIVLVFKPRRELRAADYITRYVLQQAHRLEPNIIVQRRQSVGQSWDATIQEDRGCPNRQRGRS